MRLCAERDLPAGRQGLVSPRLIRLGRKLFLVGKEGLLFAPTKSRGATHRIFARLYSTHALLVLLSREN